uniref:Nuclear FMR1 interacting protein 2 n=1 Tax=Kryptolebias marmoratus TaxID=37003 RepID=A0A3Q3A9K2_KRYMA
MSHPTNSSGNRHINNANVKQKGTQKFYTSVPKASSKLSSHKKNMDFKNDKEKALDLSHEIQPLDKRDSAVLQNGVVNCGLIINGYSSKDNDGSGSEGGYTTPKKRKARCNNAKNTDNVTREKERDMQPRNTTHELGALNLETTEKGRSTHKVEAQSAAKRTVMSEASVGESQRKNSDGKTAGTFGKKSEERHKGKLSSPSKEDSWTLFKPPPVFPVDNSSAKIVPKISYASKVKENLNKVAQIGGEVTPPPVRLFTNGPVSGNGNGCPPVDGEKALGDIFQNQWGLSFINEPNLGLEGGNVPAEDQTSVTSRNESQTVGDKVAQPFFDVSPSFVEPGPLSQEPEKRTYPKRVVVYDETKDRPNQ